MTNPIETTVSITKDKDDHTLTIGSNYDWQIAGCTGNGSNHNSRFDISSGVDYGALNCDYTCGGYTDQNHMPHTHTMLNGNDTTSHSNNHGSAIDNGDTRWSAGDKIKIEVYACGGYCLTTTTFTITAGCT